MARLEDLETFQDKVLDSARDLETVLLPLTNNVPVSVSARARVSGIVAELRILGKALDAPIGQALREKRARGQ